ncbi:hypothetical protein AACH06_22955 [Ideonella sp. DXS29W]|uniref:HTH araC/xylS-type domain-containing protein n=1 Tax=Ideonella lacteola TaxID=2984193 RepID=A0ABU9BV36_9BURK
MAPCHLMPVPGTLAGTIRALLVHDTRGLTPPPMPALERWPALPTFMLRWVWAAPDGAASRSSLAAELVSAELWGPQTQPLVEPLRWPALQLCVMLWPDALRPHLRAPVADWVDQRGPAAAALNMPLPAWPAFMASGPDGRSGLQHLIDWTRTWADPHRPPRPLPLGPWLDELSGDGHTGGAARSERQRRRRLMAITGQPMRQLRASERAERAFHAAVLGRASGDLRWMTVANDSGFSDQAHLCRDTLRLTGLSPDALRRSMLQDEGAWVFRLWARAGGVASSPAARPRAHAAGASTSGLRAVGG